MFVSQLYWLLASQTGKLSVTATLLFVCAGPKLDWKTSSGQRLNRSVFLRAFVCYGLHGWHKQIEVHSEGANLRQIQCKKKPDLRYVEWIGPEIERVCPRPVLHPSDKFGEIRLIRFWLILQRNTRKPDKKAPGVARIDCIECLLLLKHLRCGQRCSCLLYFLTSPP